MQMISVCFCLETGKLMHYFTLYNAIFRYLLIYCVSDASSSCHNDRIKRQFDINLHGLCCSKRRTEDEEKKCGEFREK